MPRTQLKDLAIDETLDATALERVRGGGVLMDKSSLNFGKESPNAAFFCDGSVRGLNQMYFWK